MSLRRRCANWLRDDNPDAYKFLTHNFQEGDNVGVRTKPRRDDLEDIAHWIAEAKRRSDLVVATIHAHEGQNGDLNTQDIADFIVPMEHRWIDAGAGRVRGHGPHTLRGVEIYKGKPIFYSLGNFFFTIATLHRYGSEVYEQHKASANATPADVYESLATTTTATTRAWRATRILADRGAGVQVRGQGAAQRGPASRRPWLRPAPTQRGIPTLSNHEEGAIILENVQQLPSLSAPGCA